tara:strand:- start:248 stop:679 length:432 start_codon:yes stop_codon:yes gene_type:complete
MIALSIEGGSRKEQRLAYDAVNFALNYLMPRKKNLSIDVNVVDIPDDADAYHCCVEKNYHEIEIQQGLIEEDFITAIFHEMVHVKQHERGELKDHGIRKAWKGEEHISIFSTTDEYMELPWEEEAYRLQEEMYTKWIKTSNLK